jgi:hypothetical protein
MILDYGSPRQKWKAMKEVNRMAYGDTPKRKKKKGATTITSTPETMATAATIDTSNETVGDESAAVDNDGDSFSSNE